MIRHRIYKLRRMSRHDELATACRFNHQVTKGRQDIRMQPKLRLFNHDEARGPWIE
ncbi:MAG: hypothetical protein V3W41_02375 [Planctomycetota bacterium]